MELDDFVTAHKLEKDFKFLNYSINDLDENINKRISLFFNYQAEIKDKHKDKSK